MTNLEKLRIVAEALHGARWQNAVARDLKINPRQVHRWVTGEYSPHEGHVSDLIAVATERRDVIEEAINSVSPQ